MLREVLEAQRQAVVELRNSGEISNDVMMRVERDLDLETPGWRSERFAAN